MNLMCSEQVILGDDCDTTLTISTTHQLHHHQYNHHHHHHHHHLQTQQQQPPTQHHNHHQHHHHQQQMYHPHHQPQPHQHPHRHQQHPPQQQQHHHPQSHHNYAYVGGATLAVAAQTTVVTSAPTSTQSAPAVFGSSSLIAPEMQRLNTARPDPTFLDDRCLENLLKAEDKAEESESGGGSYFASQKDITPAMRKIVAEWMMEVCEENKCQEEVFLLALNYMDRFLATTSVRKTHLQILAAACLLLASKLREPSCLGLPAELLVFYTDNSITRTDLIHWELCVLSRLKWDISSVTPLDFLELLLIRLPIQNKKCPDVNQDKIRKHAQAFISLAAREHNFYMFSASTLAAASIAASLNGMNWHMRTGIQFIDLLSRLTALTGVKQDYLRSCIAQMEAIFEQQLQQQHLSSSYLISITAQNIPAGDTSSVSPNAGSKGSSPDDGGSDLLTPDGKGLQQQQQQQQQHSGNQVHTPTDVAELPF